MYIPLQVQCCNYRPSWSWSYAFVSSNPAQAMCT